MKQDINVPVANNVLVALITKADLNTHLFYKWDYMKKLSLLVLI
nr:hypothetical protein [Mycoplasmopsis bovis]